MRKKLLVACLLAPTILYGQVAGSRLKPGLWEVRVVKQVVDGRDTSAQMADATRQMQQALENMPPEQRARMESMLRQHGVRQGVNGSYKICITAKMAERDVPIIDREGRCQMSKIERHGNRTTFAFSCHADGSTTTGRGSAEVTSETVATHTDATTRSASGEKHTMQIESEMRYLKADCGDVRPPEQHK